jgi:hypothetical protein
VPLDFPPPLPPSLASGPAAPGVPPFSTPPLARPQADAGALTPPRPAGPSEFTRVIAGASAGSGAPGAAPGGVLAPAVAASATPAAAPASSAAPAAAEPASGPKAKLPLVPLLLALNLIVLATIALVVFFVLKD